MKKILIPLLFVASTLTANAGSVTFVAPEASMIEEPAMMGGSGAWLIPLVIIAVLALSLSRSNSACGQETQKLVDISVDC